MMSMMMMVMMMMIITIVEILQEGRCRVFFSEKTSIYLFLVFGGLTLEGIYLFEDTGICAVFVYIHRNM